MKLPRHRGESIDWQAVRERLAKFQAATETAQAPSPERARAIMDARARALAKPAAPAGEPGDIFELLTFTLGGERYALEARFVREVMRLTDFTPVPGTPAHIFGITNLRGEVLAIVDLRRLFGLSEQGLTDLSRLVVLGGVDPDFAVLADAVHTQERLAAMEVRTPPASSPSPGRDTMRGVTADGLIVLDGAALARDERLTIDQAATPGARSE